MNLELFGRTDILSYFPLPKIRPVQERALLEVCAAFESGKKFVFLEAPPGVGKSALAVALARYYESAYVLTKTRQLQDQYTADFKDAQELKGRSNFTCERLDEGSCETGAERFRTSPCPPVECPYRVQKAKAILSKLTVCNYMSYLYSVGTTPWLRAVLAPIGRDEDPNAGNANWHRPLLVLDEAHLVEDVMMEHTSVTIDLNKLKSFFPPLDLPPPPKPNDVGDCFAWLDAFAQVASCVEEGTYGGAKAKELSRLLRRVNFALEHRSAEEWFSESLDRRTGFVLKPLTVRSFAERLFKFGDRVLLMSATILDAEMMAHDLGIDDYAYVCVSSPFPVENREVVSAALDMTFPNREWNWPKMVDVISSILDSHTAEKGLILCPSNEMVEFVLKGLPAAQRARLIPARGNNRVADYQRHLDATGPTVLIAPGYWEGADLKDDRSRFQIIPAIPFGPWSGQVRARAELRKDRRWYRMHAFAQLIQGAGRSIRSMTDSATTYVLDQRLKKEAERSDSLLPQWFKDSLIFC